jgi:two-component system chemotaxis response regulator CheY
MAKGGTEVDAERVRRVLRAIHAVRGASFLGLGKIGELAHEMENTWIRMAARKTVPRPIELRGLLLAAEKLQELIKNPVASHQADVGGLMATLAASLKADDSTPARAEPGEKKLRSLVVEDDPPSVLILKAFLGRYGQCDTAANGREGVEACRAAIAEERGYGLICMDLIMPETGGREAVQLVRMLEESAGYAAGAGAKIVMMTAVDDIREVILCFQEFSDAYLNKPVNLPVFLRQLRSWELIT